MTPLRRALEQAAENARVADLTMELARARIQELKTALEKLADQHHRTLTGSKFHDPENQSWRKCPCLTCRAVLAAVTAQPQEQGGAG